MNTSIIELLENEQALGVVGSPSNTFEAIVDIKEVSEKSKLLGELVCFHVDEGDSKVLVLGQITEIETKNRWHEEPSFKGIIKRHGHLPNLSGVADNRIAKINVQSSFVLNGDSPKAHKLANSPSTGIPVKGVTNGVMKSLMMPHKGRLVCIGKAYDTDVKVPFWFKHFGKPNDDGAGDAYHIGIFGRTGSGKTTAAANMILGYSHHHEYMSILILDPQEQFYADNNVLPNNASFANKIKRTGMKYHKYKVPEEVALPNDEEIFSKLLLDYGFVRRMFGLKTPEKRELMAESIQIYMAGRMKNPNFEIGNENPDKLLNAMIKRFCKDSKYIDNVYASGGAQLKALGNRIQKIADGTWDVDEKAKSIWDYVCKLFDSSEKINLEEIVEKVVCSPKNAIVLNISGRDTVSGMESVQLLFVNIIENSIKEKGAELYAEGKQANCLVILDEAHRFISTQSDDPVIKELSSSIIDAVRTTRKYGIGYMFITQTIESLHEEIRQQIRIFAFGYGLTSGTEFRKIKDVINDDASAKFYRSFIDPTSNDKFPFMFYGPISPLSFTGAPLFLEMSDVISNFDE